MPSSRAASRTESRRRITPASRATSTSTGGRPSRFPSARARLSPARTRSAMRLRSSCAIAATMVNSGHARQGRRRAVRLVGSGYDFGGCVREALAADRDGEPRVGRGVVRGGEEALRLQAELEPARERWDRLEPYLLQPVALRLELPLVPLAPCRRDEDERLRRQRAARIGENDREGLVEVAPEIEHELRREDPRAVVRVHLHHVLRANRRPAAHGARAIGETGAGALG